MEAKPYDFDAIEKFNCDTTKTYKITDHENRVCYLQLSPSDAQGNPGMTIAMFIRHNAWQSVQVSLTPDMETVPDKYTCWLRARTEDNSISPVKQLFKEKRMIAAGPTPWVLQHSSFDLYWHENRVMSFRKPYMPTHVLQFGINTYMYDTIERHYSVNMISELISRYDTAFKFKCELDSGTFYITLSAMHRQADSPRGYTPFEISCSKTPAMPDSTVILTYFWLKPTDGACTFQADLENTVQKLVFHKPKPMDLYIDKVCILKIRETSVLIRHLHWNKTDMRIEEC